MVTVEKYTINRAIYGTNGSSRVPSDRNLLEILTAREKLHEFEPRIGRVLSTNRRHPVHRGIRRTATSSTDQCQGRATRPDRTVKYYFCATRGTRRGKRGVRPRVAATTVSQNVAYKEKIATGCTSMEQRGSLETSRIANRANYAY